ncbi:NAD(P)-dependent alcohol dehydrogenase [Mitsuaria sp. 7]|uniref:zinc-dependent alcohol dehydrogenase family protein n=1 Tax=Mitsuaria sp. 7 TaxID=1658665 RepID=UPI0007DDFBD2|nr:NAD(P)-dependent alcohol dehydrogenase [Mitsuaria sp. 7]ANH66937.1 NADPH:quinone oxidoreductase [Mitsuaria sp. 7]
MNAYRLVAGAGIEGLRQVEVAQRALDALEVRVALSAAALNFRDLAIARGHYGGMGDQPVVPLSDGVGRVVEVGDAVTRFAVGDRVIASFWPAWIDGESSPAKTSASFGAQLDGTLARSMVAAESALVRAPDGLADAAAAAVACAGVTAWNALFVQGRLQPGASVLILGTGSVALWALQIGEAAGLRAIITSSSNDKLARAERLGAQGLVNYRETPEWQDEVLRLTGGEGVDLVLEVGGQDTLTRSLAAVRFGGRVVTIGGLSGWGEARLLPGALVGGNKTLAGIMVGSRRMTEDLVRFIDTTGLVPEVDGEFPFDEAPRAYERLASGDAFGKVVVALR